MTSDEFLVDRQLQSGSGELFTRTEVEGGGRRLKEIKISFVL